MSVLIAWGVLGPAARELLLSCSWLAGAIVAFVLPVPPLAAASGYAVIAIAVVGALVLVVILLRNES